MPTDRRLLVPLLLLILAPGAAPGARIVIVNADPPGEGLNDPRAVAPVGGNTGTTLGEQRRLVLEAAARVWGELLPGEVPIQARTTFGSLPCVASGAVLGAARPMTMHADFPNAPFGGTWYPAALANRLTGVDLDPSSEEIEAHFNGDIGTSCPFPRKMYLGLDNAAGADVDLLLVVLHELGHGLGFISLADGAGHFQNGSPAIYDRFLFDDESRTSWLDLSEADRTSAARRPGRLVWTGREANAFAATALTGRSSLRMSGVADDPVELFFGPGSFGGDPFTGSIEAPMAPASSSTGDGCAPVTNPGEIQGRVAVVSRGACAFSRIVHHAQDAGAVAAIVVDPSTGYTSMVGNDPGITIPSAEVSAPDGDRIRGALPARAFLGYDQARLGTDAWGRLRLYTPETYSAGSSVSHVDVTASPSLLMEPFLTAGLRVGVDVTLPLFADLGWFVGPTPAKTFLLPSAAHAPGRGDAFYTTDLSVSSGGTTDATVRFRFLGHDRDGRTGPEATRTVPAGGAIHVTDLLGTLFGVTADFGAVELTADSGALRITSQTSTPSPGGGTFGQAVAAQDEDDLVSLFGSRVILGVRDDAAFRTNLVLASATDAEARVDLTLLSPSGSVLGTSSYVLPPLGMTQVGGVATALGATGTPDGVLVVSTPTGGARIAAYASVIDNETNDPRTVPALAGGGTAFLLPSSAHAPGRNGALYTTDLTIANRSGSDAHVTLRFLGHDRDGRSGPEETRLVPARSALTFADVLSSVFGVGAAGDYGAIRVTSDVPGLRVVSQTSTPAPSGGTFGQSVPALTSRDLVTPTSPRTLGPVLEDASYRTNLVLANAAETAAHADLRLVSASGSVLGTAGLDLLPLEMRQVGSVVTALGGPAAGGTAGATLVVATPTPGAQIACYASIIDNATNDPRTILP